MRDWLLNNCVEQRAFSSQHPLTLPRPKTICTEVPSSLALGFRTRSLPEYSFYLNLFDTIRQVSKAGFALAGLRKRAPVVLKGRFAVETLGELSLLLKKAALAGKYIKSETIRSRFDLYFKKEVARVEEYLLGIPTLTPTMVAIRLLQCGSDIAILPSQLCKYLECLVKGWLREEDQDRSSLDFLLDVSTSLSDSARPFWTAAEDVNQFWS